MKKLLTFSLIMLSIIGTAQPYINFSFDANKAFHIKDNSRTVTDVYGLDYDIELGAKENHFGVYMFYGQFKAAGFTNYGAGVDYYPNWFKRVDMSVGIAYSPTKEKDYRGVWSGVGWYSARAVTTIWIHKNIGLSLRGQIQDRNDASKGYILEGAIGVSIRN